MTVAFRLLGWILVIFAVLGFLCWGVALARPGASPPMAWLVYAGLVAFFAIALLIITGGHDLGTTRTQALYAPLVIVVLCPFVVSVPFLFAGQADGVSAWFEAMSALTTTSASAIGLPSTLSSALVVWRCAVEWVGGWLFICFALSIQPILNIAGMRFAVNVLPRLETRSFYHRTIATARILGLLYISLTAAAALVLLISGVPAGLALPLAMAGLATGAYVPLEQGLAGISGLAPKGFLALILVMGAMNFTLHYGALRGQVTRSISAVEMRGLLRMIVLAMLAMFAVSVIAGDISLSIPNLTDTAFLAISAVTTSGLSPLGTQTASLSVGILLLSLCVIGGMAGSTTGGIKILRALLIDRFVNTELARLGSPNRVTNVEYDGRIIRVSDMLGIWSLVLVIAGSIAIGSLILSALQMPFLTAISVSLASVTNAGPMPEIMDPKFAGYGAMSPGMLITSGVLMVLGRLEFLIVLAFILSRGFRF